MVCIFCRAMLGVSALVIAAGCASAPSQPPRGSGVTSTSTSVRDLQARSSGVIIHTLAGGAVGVTLAGGPSSFSATQFTPSGSTDRNPMPPENVSLGSSAPLFILDGVPYTPGPGGLLIGINPDDIASIKALKDPADLSLYGMRGANGVIVITLKQIGAKGDSTKARPRDDNNDLVRQ
jgi:TonB-dependent SusC/RagA subfamily outer membrane receptor